ncbi:unnamed protein product [Nippostrongylus brasiliensis]|uniref:Uncharacterized protein n=1 Tax=Nippostrongylus brasiliensis TaxID=27835 RepID=A0A0N4XQF3_NIPBR|nr:unnamed protein product [Nippostrongylus brasiliensis]
MREFGIKLKSFENFLRNKFMLKIKLRFFAPLVKQKSVEAGISGLLMTCDNHEKQAIAEAYNIIDKLMDNSQGGEFLLQKGFFAARVYLALNGYRVGEFQQFEKQNLWDSGSRLSFGDMRTLEK